LFLFQFAVLVPVFAQNQETDIEQDTDDSLAKSLSLTQQAKDAYEEGDYDASIIYAEEATKYAMLSEEGGAGYAAGDSRTAAAGTTPGAGQGAGRATAQNAVAAQSASRPPAKGPSPAAARADGTYPAQYVVRSWKTTGDSFSAIAGRPWVYADASQWQVLYEANKDKLPKPDNPHFILPGMILDIPSIAGEVRQGTWTP
jgi:nucleoid-associated protein YgaU